MVFEREINLFNPNALERRFSAIQTDFDVTLGKISAIISDSEIEEYQDGHTTMHSRLSATIQDLDGFHDQVSEMKTNYDGQFESVDSRLTTFDETLEGITASVSTVSQEAIKTDTIYYLATDKGSGVTRSTSGWTTTPQSMTSTNKYLWIYHKYTKGDDSTTFTDPVIAGVWGNTGASTPLYWLSIAESSITKKKDGSLTPTSISINAKTRSGAGTEENYNGRFKIGVRYTGQSLYTTVYDSEYDESSHTYTLPSQSFDSVRIWLFKSGTATNPIDIQTISVVEEGSDAYTVVLSNESHTFAGGTSSAISGSAECSIIAMKGANRVAATIGTITGQPSGMTTSISGNGTQNAKFTVNVTTSMNTRNGVLTIPVTVDRKLFSMSFTYSLALKGAEGVGVSKVESLRYVSNSTTPPAKPMAEVTRNDTARGVWTKALPSLTDTYKYIYTCDQVLYDDTSIGNNGFVWTDVVLNNALTDLVTRVAAAELKIQDDEIVVTVRKSESYKNDLASKNASYTGDYIPTASNAPASGWATDDEKSKHLNDTFMSTSGKIYQYIQGSYGLRITFSTDSKTENTRYDYVRIYYQKDGKTYALPDIGGTDIANKSVFIPTNAFWLYWKTDRSQQYYGFRIVNVEWAFSSHPIVTESSLPSIAATDTSGTDYPETDHPYTANEEKMWKYTTGYTPTPTFTYGWVEREDPSIRTLEERMSSAELKITADAIVSTVTGSDFGNLVTSAIEQTATGIHLKAKYVSWDSTYSSMTKDGKLKCTGAEITGILTTIGDEEISGSKYEMIQIDGGRIKFYNKSSINTLIGQMTGYAIDPFPSTTIGTTFKSMILTSYLDSIILGFGELPYNKESPRIRLLRVAEPGANRNALIELLGKTYVAGGIYSSDVDATQVKAGDFSCYNSGSHISTLNANTRYIISINFDEPYSVLPYVFITLNTNNGDAYSVTANLTVVTKSGFKVTVNNPHNFSVTSTLYWIALIPYSS